MNGVRIDPRSPTELAGTLDAFLDCGLPHVVHFVPADPTVIARRAPRYREILNAGDLNVPDGMAVVWALRLAGHRAERLTGTEALDLVAGWGVGRGLAHYLFGAAPHVLESLRRRLEERHPGIHIAGAESPPYRPLSEAELEAAAGRMRAAETDVVWIGLGTPKQDLVAERLRRRGAAPVMMCVGAAFDFAAGAKPRAPEWMRRAGLEWLHRLGSEPRRLWRRYLVGNPAFVFAVLRDFVTSPGRR